jgi:hypothetical protein
MDIGLYLEISILSPFFKYGLLLSTLGIEERPLIKGIDCIYMI